MTQELGRRLRAAAARRDVSTHRPILLDANTVQGKRALGDLLETPGLVVVDAIGEQLDELVRTRAPRGDLDAAEVARRAAALVGDTPMEAFGAWAYYPWSSRLVHVLPQALHRELRSDRNRYKIRAEEQARLFRATVAVAGLSVGRAVVSSLVREGACGELRLADFDTLSLSNLNRIAGTLDGVGISKVVLAAREAAELDPFLAVRIFPDGVRDDNAGAFLDGADVLVDECDDLGVKISLRERARAAGIPVVMATSDRGMLDVERFDLEPGRPIFHGLLEGVRSTDLAGLTTKQKVPYVLRILDADRLAPRMAASLVEVKETISTWPQLASDVAVGGAMVTNAVRRILLGTFTASGRFLADLDAIIAAGAEAALPEKRPLLPEPVRTTSPELAWPAPGAAGPTEDEVRFIVTCATLAPSGGNVQPWRFEAAGSELRCAVDPARSASLLNYAERGTYLALGAALEGAIVAARALGFDPRSVTTGDGTWTWRLELSRTRAAEGAREGVERLRHRCSNRRVMPAPPVTPEEISALRREGEPLETIPLTDARGLARLGETLGELDRVRMLSPRFHRELFSELRWTRLDALARKDGIDLASLELDATDLAALHVVRQADPMALLAELEAGRALGSSARTAFLHASAALVLCTRGTSPAQLLDCGRGLLRLWSEATARGIAVHPWGSPFLFQRLEEAGSTLEPWERAVLEKAAKGFEAEVGRDREQVVLLILRLSKADPPTARSVRRSVEDVLTFA